MHMVSTAAPELHTERQVMLELLLPVIGCIQLKHCIAIAGTKQLMC